MKHIIRTVVLITLISCINIQPYIDSKIEGNNFQNNYLKLKIPNGWNLRKAGGHMILIMQKRIDNHGVLAFPTVILEAGTTNNNSFITYFDNLESLVRGSHDIYSKNEIYAKTNRIDSTYLNGIELLSFETKIINKKYKIAEMIQTHYFFNIDTMYFHLSVSDYDRFEYLKKDYKQLLESIEKN